MEGSETTEETQSPSGFVGFIQSNKVEMEAREELGISYSPRNHSC